jgi:adenine-specific DNA methylase
MAGDSLQLTLSFLDTTSLSRGSLTLDAGRHAPSRPAAREKEDEPPAVPAPMPARDYRLTGDRALAGGWKARAADNLAAIRLSEQITNEHRAATPQEQKLLARFTGFGATDLANHLFRRQGEMFPSGWVELGLELETLVSREDLASLARTTQYAHYTPEYIVRAIWQALMHMGFAGGTILEPGCGTGLFFALMPEALAKQTNRTGIEMDPVTARITRLLYPNALIRGEDFTKARLPDTYDLVLGNPPFSTRQVSLEVDRTEHPSGRLSLSLHDYFIARAIERLKPGGLAAFVTSRWTLDKADPKARAHLASLADLIGAIRLPEGAMSATAGTSVVADILFLQRRAAGQAQNAILWDDLAEAVPAEDGEEALSINRYFLDHPEMVLGTHDRTSTPYGPGYTCKGLPGP